jgi:hypothetical protein
MPSRYLGYGVLNDGIVDGLERIWKEAVMSGIGAEDMMATTSTIGQDS